jgi:hypothetical protein
LGGTQCRRLTRTGGPFRAHVLQCPSLPTLILYSQTRQTKLVPPLLKRLASMCHPTFSRFPPCGAFTVSFSVFNRFPKSIDLVVSRNLQEESNLNGEHRQIFGHCSPFDLAQLAMTSKSLRSLIRGHRHLWIAAQGNVSRRACLGIPALPGNYSHSVYALFIFGGGPVQ